VNGSHKFCPFEMVKYHGFFLFTVLVNGLAGSTTILGGKNTSQISDANPTLITPAGYVFSIWGVIYILLGVFVVFQALPSLKGKDYRKRIDWLFVLSSLLSILWLFRLRARTNAVIEAFCTIQRICAQPLHGAKNRSSFQQSFPQKS
jgi:tryptophan-rich sensory protein